MFVERIVGAAAVKVGTKGAGPWLTPAIEGPCVRRAMRGAAAAGGVGELAATVKLFRTAVAPATWLAGRGDVKLKVRYGGRPAVGV